MASWAGGQLGKLVASWAGGRGTPLVAEVVAHQMKTSAALLEIWIDDEILISLRYALIEDTQHNTNDLSTTYRLSRRFSF